MPPPIWNQAVPASKLIFDKYDTDGSGAIDKHELLAMCKEMGRPLDPVEHAHAMRVLDASGNGLVSYEEFLAWWAHGLSMDVVSDPMGREKLQATRVTVQAVGRRGGGGGGGTTYAETDDLCNVGVLSEEVLLKTLEARFREGRIYTDNGPMLVAVNPFRRLPLYGPDKLLEYIDEGRRSLPPHIYKLSARCFSELQLDRRSQAVLVSGESGAGKTETTKAVLRILSAQSAATAGRAQDVLEGGADLLTGGLEARLVETAPLLEAFGNCKTCRNNNSSRFGKLVVLRLGAAGTLASSEVETYLLEKSRVVSHAADERSYHVFYQLCAGATPLQRRELGLSDPTSALRYLRGGAQSIAGVDDASDFEATLGALRAVGLASEELQAVLCVLAGLLHLGNLDFRGADSATLASDTRLKSACALLGCGLEDIRMATTARRLKVGREWITKQLTAREAAESVDALSKALYERLFDYLVVAINEGLATATAAAREADGVSAAAVAADADGSSLPFFGVLDIFGFECFDVNSLEQLAINYANEKLQGHFNRTIFTAALRDYEAEGIPVGHIAYPDNRGIVDAIEGRPHGVLALLQEECSLGSGSDANLLSKLRSHHTASAAFKISRRHPTAFVLCHFAGDVRYETGGFLAKNKDPLHEDLMLAVRESSSPLVASLFSPRAAKPHGHSGGHDGNSATPGRRNSAVSRTNAPRPAAVGGGPGGGGGGRFKGVLQHFQLQLKQLLELLDSAHCSFVRCIKPNTLASPDAFDVEHVTSQLRCAGVVEAVKVSRAGYPVRVPYARFAEDFAVLATLRPDAQLTPQPGALGAAAAQKECRRLLEASAMAERRVAFGRNKLFLSGDVYEELQLARRALHARFATSLQRGGRGMLARGMVRRERERRAEEERRRIEEEARLRRLMEAEERRLREEARRRQIEAEAEEEALAARVAAAEARLREEEEARRLAQDEAAARARDDEARREREAQLLRRLAEVEEAERQLRESDALQQRALHARMGAEQRAASSEAMLSLSSLSLSFEAGAGGPDDALAAAAERSSKAQQAALQAQASALHAAGTSASELSATPSRRRISSSSSAGRVVPRTTPPTSPTAADLPMKQPDFGYGDEPAAAEVPALDRRASSSSSNGQLPELPDAPTDEAGVGGGGGAGDGGAGEASVQPTGGEMSMTSQAMQVLGAVSREEYHGIVEYAAYLGMHPARDAQLLWIARDTLHASVPSPWVEGLDMRDRLYYYNTTTEETLREHPLDEYYRQLYAHHTGQPSLLDDAGGAGLAALSALPDGVDAAAPIIHSGTPGAAATAAAAAAAAAAAEPRLGVALDAEQRTAMPEDLVGRLSPLEEDDAEMGGAGAVSGAAVPYSPFSRSYRGIRRALLRPPHHEGVMRGHVKRTKTLTSHRYDFYLELPGYRLFCMSAARLTRSLTSYYCICLEQGSISRDSQAYLGKLRSAKVGGTDWTLYDNGLNHRDAQGDPQLLRRQLLALSFEKNFLGSGGPSQLQVVVPLDFSSAAAVAPDDKPDESLVERWRQNSTEGLVSLRSKEPEWSEELKTYTLEYNGRATLASVKNIQLVPEHHHEPSLLFQMGKVSEDRFNLDWRAPLSAIQAFGIALAVFDGKIACSPAPPSLRAVLRMKESIAERTSKR